MTKFLITCTVIITLLVGGYFLAQKNFIQKQTPQSTEKLTIALLDIPTFALIHIAQNKGYFREEGLDVTYRKFPTGINALTDALAGNSDVAVAYETPAVRKIYEGEKIRIITTLHASTKDMALVARKDKGITTIADLKDKKIGVTKKSATDFFATSYLLNQGIRLNEVTFVDGALDGMGALLREGKADAVAVANPYLYTVKQEFPQESLSIFQSEVYTENSVLAGREDVIKNKREALIRLLKALEKAENLYKSNNQEALNVVVVELPLVSEESIRGTWDQYTLELKLNNVLLTLLEREGQWFKVNNVYQGEVPNFRDFIFTDYLKEVNPDAVTIY